MYPNSYSSTAISSITIDLQAVQPIEQIKIWHYYCDARKYSEVKLEVSYTGSCTGEQTTVYNEAIGPVETEDGIAIDFNLNWLDTCAILLVIPT